LNSLKPVRRRVSWCIRDLNPEALLLFLELKIWVCIHFIHGTSEICWKNVDFHNFSEIPVVIPFATMFVVTDLTFIIILCNLRLPWKKSGCLLALQVALDYSPMMAHIL
jgi:apolipoprotein N-acyltransferase